MSKAKQIGLITCIGIVAGNMMGSGIALLPSNLAGIGSIAIFGWIIALVGALSLAFVYSKLATVDPQEGGPIAYAGEVSKVFGFQTGVLYYHANWIGNLAIGITAVSYLSTFFPSLNNSIWAGCVTIAIVWLFTGINLLGGAWISRLTTVGLCSVLIPVVFTAIFGWFYFDPSVYMANWNATSQPETSAIVKSVLFCLWAFIGVESASVSTGLVKNPKRTVPLATMLGTCLAGIVYIAASQVIAGMFPNSVMAASGAPFAVSTSKMIGAWAAPVVSAMTAFACLTSLGSWMMLVGQAGARAAHDGNFPKCFGELDKNGVPRKGLILAACMMTGLMVVIMLLNSSAGHASALFGTLTSIAVLLTMLPYFYSCIDLIRVEAATTRSILSVIACCFGCGFVFVAFAGADLINLACTMVVSLIILMFYSWKRGKQETLLEARMRASQVVRSTISAATSATVPATAPVTTQKSATN